MSDTANEERRPFIIFLFRRSASLFYSGLYATEVVIRVPSWMEAWNVAYAMYYLALSLWTIARDLCRMLIPYCSADFIAWATWDFSFSGITKV